MKKSLPVLLLVLWLGSMKAQTNVYHEFPDSNAFWNVTTQGCCWTGCAGPPTPNPIIADSWFSYYINGDTTINSVAYRKMYKSGSTHEHCAYGNAVNVWYYYDDYECAFREDTALKIVYSLYPSAASEVVWFDFSVGVGGLVIPSDQCTEVASIDSVLVGSAYRKRFNLVNTTTYYFIEGIGSTAGLNEPVCPFEYSGTLNCFGQDGQTLYPDTTATCDIITSVPAQPMFSFQLTVVPNPVHADAVLLSGLALDDATLTVLNSLGQPVMQLNSLNGHSIRFDCSELESGFYFVQVASGKGRSETIRIAVVH